jgi:phytoene desaturase
MSSKVMKKAVVIGAGFAGLSSAAVLAKEGFDVTVIDKGGSTGGRARTFSNNGFLFDMGPSWYWMPDVLERFFKRFGKSPKDYFTSLRLDPSYQVIFSEGQPVVLPASIEGLKTVFEEIEKGSGEKLEKFLKEAGVKYTAGINDFVYRPSVSLSEFADPQLLKSLFKLDLLKPFSKHVRQYFKNPKLIRIMEFPILFLGAMPDKIPALYSMMNYADMTLGTWYPMGGMSKIPQAMTALAEEAGAKFKLNTNVQNIRVEDNKVVGVQTDSGFYEADVVVAGADYHHVEQKLLEPQYRNYSEKYWEKKTFAPSCLIYYVGVNKKLPKLLHHNLFFDADMEQHAQEIYTTKKWPEHPLFYLCCPSKTDPGVAPEGNENLFILIPVAAGLKDSPDIREKFFLKTLERIEEFCGEKFSDQIVVKESYAYSDFVNDYNSYKGNAYGLANTLSQTAILKPGITNKKVNNLFYTGQLTVPGPGVPPSVISGQVVADFIIKNIKP